MSTSTKPTASIPSCAWGPTRRALTLQNCGYRGENTLWVAMPNDNIGGYEPLMASNSTVANTPDIMTVVGGYSYMTTQEMTLDLGAFSPYQMLQDVKGVL
jgi:hypothetical protein